MALIGARRIWSRMGVAHNGAIRSESVKKNKINSKLASKSERNCKLWLWFNKYKASLLKDDYFQIDLVYTHTYAYTKCSVLRNSKAYVKIKKQLNPYLRNIYPGHGLYKLWHSINDVEYFSGEFPSSYFTGASRHHRYFFCLWKWRCNFRGHLCRTNYKLGY